ncbi:MAG: ArnT family glycosyltransferase [Prosthecobacter sp.]|uniref:ArnT family glycosyltransferase n=1 Tax=Prosthecobacter sp. TaxID=1965333 RepID=UPI0038FFFEFE
MSKQFFMGNIKAAGKEHAVAGFMLLGLLACVVLLALRVTSAVTLDRPFLGNTSGLEEEALFSVWKAQNGEPIYTDAFAAPFATSYFNWLFYAAYALWGKLWSTVWPVAAAWLPTIWRSLSLFFCLGTWLILWRSVFNAPTAAQGRGASLFAFGAAGICVCNPLFHWMSFSVRPDVGAVFCEVAGFALLLRHARQVSLRCVVLAGLAVALAWSFKQSQVFLFAGGCVYLGWHRQWRALAAFAAPLLIVVAATLTCSNEWYYQNTVLLHALTSQFDPAQGFKLAAAAMAKAPFMLMGALLLVPLLVQWRSLTPELRLTVMLAAVSLPLCLITSSKLGAGDYYYLAPSVFAAVLVVASRRAVVGGIVLQLIAVGLIFSGQLGRVNIRDDQNLTLRLQQRLQHEQGPLLITGRPYNLPWLHPGRPAFVFSYLYDEYERRYPERLQQGLRPLIQQRYFRLVVDVDDPPLDFSPELAAAYTLAETGDGFRIYRPRQP